MMQCVTCSEELAARQQKFCSIACQKESEYRLYIERWHAGLESGNSGKDGVSRHVRRYLHEKYNGACSECGWCKKNPVTGKTPLNVEHIDGNSQNSKEENLNLLCPCCHSLTPTYGVLNRGRGRKYRHSV